MPNSLSNIFHELFQSNEHAVFIDELWINRRSLKYRNLLRQTSKSDNYFEVESKNLTEENVVSTLTESSISAVDQPVYRRATDFLETNSSGVMVFHQSHLMSGNVLHLVSRIVRFAKRQNLDWKFIFLGNGKEVESLSLDQLFIDRHFPAKSKRKSSAAISKTTGAIPKKTLSLVLPLVCLGIAFLLLSNNQQEENSSLIPVNQSEAENNVGTLRGELGTTTENEKSVRNAVLLEAIRESRMRDLEFERKLAEIDAQANSIIEDAGSTLTTESDFTDSTQASVPQRSQPVRTNFVQLPAEAETAIRNGDLATVRNVLISDELRISENEVGETPLIVATNSNAQEIVNWLIEENVPVNLADKYGRNAIFYASISGNDALIERMIDAGGDVNIRSNLSKTPLMAAVNNNNLSAVQLLLDNGSNINTVDHSGWPAIFYAAWNTNLEMVNLLLDSGADTSVVDNSGVSLVEIAAAKDATEIVALLQ